MRSDSAAKQERQIVRPAAFRLHQLLQVILLSSDAIKHEPAKFFRRQEPAAGQNMVQTKLFIGLFRIQNASGCSTRVWQFFLTAWVLKRQPLLRLLLPAYGSWIFFQPGVNGFEGRFGDASRCYRSLRLKKEPAPTRTFALLSPLHYVPRASQGYGELTAAYGQSRAQRLSVESGNVRELMQTYRRAQKVIFVSNRNPETTVAQDIEAHGLVMQWARSIRAAVELLDSAREKTVVATELALADGNWRDLVERVNSIDINISTPIVLVTSSSTAELWWDALECGIDDILPASSLASRLSQLLETEGAS